MTSIEAVWLDQTASSILSNLRPNWLPAKPALDSALHCNPALPVGATRKLINPRAVGSKLIMESIISATHGLPITTKSTNFYAFVSRSTGPRQLRGTNFLQNEINQQLHRLRQQRIEAAIQIQHWWRAYYYRPNGPAYQASQAHFEALCRRPAAKSAAAEID